MSVLSLIIPSKRTREHFPVSEKFIHLVVCIGNSYASICAFISSLLFSITAFIKKVIVDSMNKLQQSYIDQVQV